MEQYNPNQKDFTNEDLRRKILASGTDEEFKELQKFYNENKIPPEKIALFRYYARLRYSTTEEMKKALDARKENDPTATKEELNLGAYQEAIEPQVRHTVLNLRRQGYNTYESGFYGEGGEQKIGFIGEPLKDFLLPKELTEKLKEQGVEIKVAPNSIYFSPSREMNITELKVIWDEIVSVLPDLGKPAEPNPRRAAQVFREKNI